MLVPAYGFGSAMAASMALATVTFTASAELAQITVAPFFLAAITSAALGAVHRRRTPSRG